MHAISLLVTSLLVAEGFLLGPKDYISIRQQLPNIYRLFAFTIRSLCDCENICEVKRPLLFYRMCFLRCICIQVARIMSLINYSLILPRNNNSKREQGCTKMKVNISPQPKHCECVGQRSIYSHKLAF